MVVLDNLSRGHREFVEKVLQVKLIVGDTGDRSLLDDLFATHSIAAVMHFAAYANDLSSLGSCVEKFIMLREFSTNHPEQASGNLKKVVKAAYYQRID